MGFRNLQQITALAKYGKFNNARGNITSFSADEFAILSIMALQSADYPLDVEAKKKKLMPRTYMYGWLELARALGMVLTDNMDNITIINNEPHDLRKESSAISRISRTVAKLKAKGLVKCLKTSRYSKRSSAVWLLTIGDEDENRECEQYVRARLSLAPPKPESTPSITQTVNQTASAASLLPRPPAIITAEDSPTPPTPPTVEEEQQDDTPKEKPQAPVRHFIGFRNQT